MNTYVLHGDEIGSDQGNVVVALEHLDHTGVVNTRDKDGEKVGEKRGLLLQVERKGLVIAKFCDQYYVLVSYGYAHFHIGDLDHDFLELIMLPGIRRPLHHGQRGVVKFVILDK
jgi:hypothetical protein